MDLDADANRNNNSSGLTVSFLEGRTESIGFKKASHVLPSSRVSPKSPRLKVQFVDASNLEETE